MIELTLALTLSLSAGPPPDVMTLPGEADMLPVTVTLCGDDPVRMRLDDLFVLEARRGDEIAFAKIDTLGLDRLKRTFAEEAYRRWMLDPDAESLAPCADGVAAIVCHFGRCRDLLDAESDGASPVSRVHRRFEAWFDEFFAERRATAARRED